MVENGCHEAKFATDEEKPTTDEEKLTTGVQSTPLTFRGYGHHRSIRFKSSTITRPPTTASFSTRAATPRHVTYFGGARDGEKEMLRKKYHVVRKKNHVVRKLFYVASIFGGAAGRKNMPPWELSSTASRQCVTEHPHFLGNAQTSHRTPIILTKRTPWSSTGWRSTRAEDRGCTPPLPFLFAIFLSPTPYMPSPRLHRKGHRRGEWKGVDGCGISAPRP